MSEQKESFLGTYYDKAMVLKLVKLTDISAWAVGIVYAADFLLAIGTFALQIVRGMFVGWGFTDFLQNFMYIVERPFRGIVYFVLLRAVAQVLLIFMDTEDNTRRAARNKKGNE